MIELCYWPTPNGHKLTMFLEEAGIDYTIKPVDITQGDQFKPAFLAFSPNNRMPAIIDRAPADGGAAISVFESGAILLYLAEKSGQFLSSDARTRNVALEWLFWQVGGLGPMLGQNHHFNRYAQEKIAYAIERYANETHRLYGVLDKRLHNREFINGADYCIADMACYPWIVPHEAQGMDLAEFANLQRWFQAVAARPATVGAYALAENYRGDTGSEAARKHLFGQR